MRGMRTMFGSAILAAVLGGCSSDGGDERGSKSGDDRSDDAAASTELVADKSTTGRITVADGGRLAIPGGAAIEIPSQSVAGDVDVTLTAVGAESAREAWRHEYRVRPDLELEKKATLEFPLPKAEGDSGGAAEAATDSGTAQPVARQFAVSFRRGGGRWQPATAVVDEAAGVVRVETDHFSDWRVEELPAGDFIREGDEDDGRRYFKTDYFKVYFEEIAPQLNSVDDEFQPEYARRVAAELEGVRKLYKRWGFRTHDADGSLGRTKHQEVRLVVKVSDLKLPGTTIPRDDASGFTARPWEPVHGGVIFIKAVSLNDLDLEPLERIAPTIWHEYFHRCQHQYSGITGPKTGALLDEATATVMQVLVDPGYAAFDMKHDEITPMPIVDKSLLDLDYNGMPFFLHLAEKYGGRGFEHKSILTLWEQFAGLTGAFTGGGSAFQDTIRDFRVGNGGDSSEDGVAALNAEFHAFAEAFYVRPTGPISAQVFPVFHARWRNGTEAANSSIIREEVLFDTANTQPVVFDDKQYLTAEFRWLQRAKSARMKIEVNGISPGTMVRIYSASGELLTLFSVQDGLRSFDLGHIAANTKFGVLVSHADPAGPGHAHLTIQMQDEPEKGDAGEMPEPAGPPQRLVYRLSRVEFRKNHNWVDQPPTDLGSAGGSAAVSSSAPLASLPALPGETPSATVSGALNYQFPATLVFVRREDGGGYRLEGEHTTSATVTASWNNRGLARPQPSGVFLSNPRGYYKEEWVKDVEGTKQWGLGNKSASLTLTDGVPYNGPKYMDPATKQFPGDGWTARIEGWERYEIFVISHYVLEEGPPRS